MPILARHATYHIPQRKQTPKLLLPPKKNSNRISYEYIRVNEWVGRSALLLHGFCPIVSHKNLKIFLWLRWCKQVLATKSTYKNSFCTMTSDPCCSCTVNKYPAQWINYCVDGFCTYGLMQRYAITLCYTTCSHALYVLTFHKVCFREIMQCSWVWLVRWIQLNVDCGCKSVETRLCWFSTVYCLLKLLQGEFSWKRFVGVNQ